MATTKNSDSLPNRCFICGEDTPSRLQTHHIVPRRHGGSDNSENLVRLCANCHQAIEKMYDKRFYQELGVEKQNTSDTPRSELITSASEITKGEMYVWYMNQNAKSIVWFKREERNGGQYGEDRYVFENALTGMPEKRGGRALHTMINEKRVRRVDWDVPPADAVAGEPKSTVELKEEYDPWA